MCNDDGSDGDGGGGGDGDGAITIWYRYCGLTFVIRITYVPLNRIALKDTPGHTHNEHSKQFHLLLLNTMIVIAPHKFERIASSSSTNNACIHKCFLINF